MTWLERETVQERGRNVTSSFSGQRFTDHSHRSSANPTFPWNMWTLELRVRVLRPLSNPSHFIWWSNLVKGQEAFDKSCRGRADRLWQTNKKQMTSRTRPLWFRWTEREKLWKLGKRNPKNRVSESVHDACVCVCVCGGGVDVGVCTLCRCLFYADSCVGLVACLTPGCIPSGLAAGWCLSPPRTRSGCSLCRWRRWNESRLSCRCRGSDPQTSSGWTPVRPGHPFGALQNNV